MRNIHVRYGCAPISQKELAFAIDLARRLSGHLFVWTVPDRSAATLLADPEAPDARTREHAHIRDRVALEVGRAEIAIPLKFCEGDPRDAARDDRSVVIARRGAKKPAVAAAIYPMGETSVMSRGGGEVCVPFANGESALDAVIAAIPFAAALKTGLLFYHTTWREDGIPDDAPPERHMSAEADAILKRLQAAADQAQVRHRTVIETATAVAEGAVRAAQMAHCALIAMARARDVGDGSHVDQVLERSVIPVIVAGRSPA